jgi:2-polyprenyl-6-methoxyphenol hydroxylase-like FAD-dependent oxidoreductase
MSLPTHTPDVFIIGGGPAGLATAILAAQHGLRVAVADHNRPPIDKTCGEGLMPDTVTAIKALGLAIGCDEAVPFRGIRFCDVHGVTCAEAQFGQGFGLGIRRTVLHAKLAQRAAELGVAFLWGSRVTLAAHDQVFCDNELVQCKWLIGADGEASPFRRWAGLDETLYERVRFAARQHFHSAPWTDFVEVYWGRDFQIVVAPIASEELCIVVISRNPRLRMGEAISQVPALASRLRNLRDTGIVRGARTALRRLRRVCGGRFALVGDASGSVDPLTGEGIGLAFKQAGALLGAIEARDLQLYQAAHESIGRASRFMSRLMLIMDAHPYLRRRALRMFAAEPSLFSRFLELNVGELTLSKFGLGHALRLGWRMLTPGWEL